MSVPSLKNSDSEPLHRLARRDPDALAGIFDEYSSLTYSVLIRITRDPGLAEDLSQEVFLRLWTRARDYNPDRGSLHVWIAVMARNLGIDYTRSAQARFAMRLLPMPNTDRSAFGSRHNESAFADTHLVRKTLSALSSDQRQMLELAYFEGCTQSEIARRLRKPIGTVKSCMRAALQKARSALGTNSTPA